MRRRFSTGARIVLLGGIVVLVGSACAPAMQPTGAGDHDTMFTGTAFISSGDRLTLIVDTQASLVAERQEFLPLQVALLNRTDERIEISRESFLLEASDGTRFPLASYSEFRKNYPRHRVDLRVGRNYLESLSGRYPTPPFSKRPLEFFPLRESSVVPRDRISLRNSEMAVGFIYFRLTDLQTLDPLGTCRLLFAPSGEETQYVLDLQVYRRGKNR